MLTESPREPSALAPITFLTAAVRAELTDLRRHIYRPGVVVDARTVAETLVRVSLLLEQIERHATE